MSHRVDRLPPREWATAEWRCPETAGSESRVVVSASDVRRLNYCPSCGAEVTEAEVERRGVA